MPQSAGPPGEEIEPGIVERAVELELDPGRAAAVARQHLRAHAVKRDHVGRGDARRVELTIDQLQLEGCPRRCA